MGPPPRDPPGPFRPVNWRWELAVDLADNAGRPFRRCDDPAVRSARRFRQSWVSCRGEGDRRVLAAGMPTMYQAFSVYADPHGVTRAAVEARVLAAEAPQAIARKCGTAAAVIQVYEEVFFDARAHLGRVDYVLNQVIGPRLREGGGAWGYDLLWKFYGYLGGERVLDEVMDAGPVARPQTPQEVGAFLSADARGALRRQLVAAARLLPAGDRRTAAELLKMQARLASREGAGEDEVARDGLEKHIEAMLQEIPWAVGAQAEKTTPPKVAEYDAGAAEVRGDELLLLAEGQEPPDLAALKEVQLPPPKPRAEKHGLLDSEEPLR
jgi:hypothetical protein